MPFKKLEIIDPILKAIESQGYEKPSPIQEYAIPILLSGKDIMGSAQTGTGKTAAFAIPLLQNITNKGNRGGIKALILTPTRELALQIKESFDTYGKFLPLKTVVIFGGVKQGPQTKALKAGCDILVATPGRLLDLITQGFINLDYLDYFVLDEADRMLDMGFIRDVKKIISKIPEKRQTMLFSATLPKNIIDLADSILTNPERVEITPVESTVDAISQSVCYVKQDNKFKLLMRILKDKEYTSILIFSRTKRNANSLAKRLIQRKVSASAIHGNKSQSARTEALRLFKANKVRVLVATDVAARGVDIDDLSLVIQYNLPDVPETYIHRIGRTGRANKTGKAIAFVNNDEVPLLQAIQRHINMYIPVEDDMPYHAIFKEAEKPKGQNKKQPSKKTLTVEHKQVNKPKKNTKKSGTRLTEKIKHSQPKKQTDNKNKKKKGWAKTKTKSKPTYDKPKTHVDRPTKKKYKKRKK